MSQRTQPVDQESQLPNWILVPARPNLSQPASNTFVRILNRTVPYRTVEFNNGIYADIITPKKIPTAKIYRQCPFSPPPPSLHRGECWLWCWFCDDVILHMYLSIYVYIFCIYYICVYIYISIYICIIISLYMCYWLYSYLWIYSYYLYERHKEKEIEIEIEIEIESDRER